MTLEKKRITSLLSLVGMKFSSVSTLKYYFEVRFSI